MKNKFYLLSIIMIIALTSCGKNVEQIDSVKDKEDILKLLDENFKAYQKWDVVAVMKCYADDPNIIAFGPNPSALGKGYQEIKKLYETDFSLKYMLIKYEFNKTYVFFSGNISWLTADIKTYWNMGGRPVELDARMSVVLKKIEGKWYFMQTTFQTFEPPPKTEIIDEEK